MSGIITVLIMATLLGAASFGVGMVPLFFKVSSEPPPITLDTDEPRDSNVGLAGARIAYLSTIGTGLLLGAALGVIIPEGIETVVSSSESLTLPTNKIALSLLAGFAFMLLVEQLLSGHSHSQPHPPGYAHLPTDVTENTPDGPKNARTSEEEFDMALAELEGSAPIIPPNGDRGPTSGVANDIQESLAKAGRARAFPLTLGLVIHSLADGLALGASALPRGTPVEGEEVGAAATTQLSIVVFLALIIHKAPTALALSMSLLSTSLPRSECKKHMAFFSASTPLGALASFAILSFLGAGAGGDWAGIALLVSGGTFLYVATVLQPLSHHDGPSPSSHEMSDKLKVGLTIFGMFIPFCIGLVTGHEH